MYRQSDGEETKKGGKAAGPAIIAIDVGAGVYENRAAGTSTRKTVADAGVDAAFAVGGLAASMGRGALFGAAFGPAGAVAGAIIGAIVYGAATEGVKYKGKSLKDNAKEGLSKSLSIG